MKKDNPAPGADGVKNTESEGHSLGARAGGRPVRKRGYHRALKRGESWAISEKFRNDSINSVIMAYKVMFEYPIRNMKLYNSFAADIPEEIVPITFAKTPKGDSDEKK